MRDQAEGLRRLTARLQASDPGRTARVAAPAAAPRPTVKGVKLARVLAVTSGKGGVGKTSLAVNLALAARELGLSVGLVDADLGLANADILLGVVPSRHLGHVLEGTCSLTEALMEGPGGIWLLAGASGLLELADADASTLRRLAGELRTLDRLVDLVIIDTGAGIGRQVLSFLAVSKEVLVVLTPEPTSLTDAYSLIKLMTVHNPHARLYAVINMCTGGRDGLQAGARLATVARRYLGVDLQVVGTVPRDDAVGEAVVRQVPLLLGQPRSPAAGAIRAVAAGLFTGSPAPAGSGLSGAFFRLMSALRANNTGAGVARGEPR